ncbi:kelch-like protein 23 [Nelusetta ayraudi]|uniref:kelch-like protein 23 n=1 Tax=Nelusetta ayraudi TaxID=303726 RepID=UPI003F7227F7
MDVRSRGAMSLKPAEVYAYDFCDGGHPAELLDALRRFQASGLFADVSLRCGESGQVFQCHRALLSARSAYFQVMFTADMRERSDRVVTLRGVDAAVLGALVDYVYTARVRITEGTVQSLLEAADLLQFSAVKRACEEFLVRLLDVDNCLGMHAFAQLHLCAGLEREARRVILSRFGELLAQDEFLELGHEALGSLLAACHAVQRDEALVDALVKWVTHDLDNRVHRAADLLRSIHMDLDEVYFKAALDVHGQCRLSSEGKLKTLLTQALRCGDKGMSACRKLSSSMYVIGGYYWHPLCEVHIWDPVSDTWVQGKDMPDPARESYSISLLGGNIYVTGGYRTNTVEALDTVSVYNCDYDEWTEGQPMITARYYHCSVAMHGCIYAIGGYKGGAPEQEAEFYDPLKKKWFPVAKMIQGVGNATACVMGEKIYVSGGHHGYRGNCTYEKIQVYRSDVNEWSVLTVAPHPEYGLCCVPLNNMLYLVGGQTTVADCYNIERDEWRPISVMKERRMECGAVVINGCVYVSGGYSYSKGTYLQSIEKYDPQLDSWEIVGTLPSPTRSHGCVCVFGV